MVMNPQSETRDQSKGSDDRPITGTGIYDFSSKFENLELNDSDNYSDEDFYSDEFETVEEEYHPAEK
jgi:hypothetical protein